MSTDGLEIDNTQIFCFYFCHLLLRETDTYPCGTFANKILSLLSFVMCQPLGWAWGSEGAAKPLSHQLHQLHLCGAHVVEAEVFSEGFNGFACSLCPAGTVSHAGHTCRQRAAAILRAFLQSLWNNLLCKCYRIIQILFSMCRKGVSYRGTRCSF